MPGLVPCGSGESAAVWKPGSTAHPESPGFRRGLLSTAALPHAEASRSIYAGLGLTVGFWVCTRPARKASLIDWGTSASA